MMHNVSAFIGQLKWLYLKTRPRQLDNIQTFDEASRGPYGSLMFLFKASWNMATLGAIITILRLGFSPMVQAVIDLNPRQIPIPDQGVTFGFAHAYDRNVRPDDMGGRYPCCIEFNANWLILCPVIPSDPDMQSAMIKGLYDIKTNPLFNCSGSCSWDNRWISLGFKSVCENITTATLNTKSCIETPARRLYKRTILRCHMTTPSNITLATAYSNTEWGTEFCSNTTVLDVPNESTNNTDLIKVAILRSELNKKNYRELHTDITECTIRYVAYEYTDATAVGNNFSFRENRSFDLKWLAASNELPLDGWRPRGLITNPARDDVPELSSSPADLGALRDFLESETFRMNATSHGLGAFLGLQVNISQRFDNMASSMTEYLRSGPNMQLAKGNRIESVNFVNVNWYWLIGPAILELAALIFAIYTIVSNARKHKVPLWKSSALVLLACQYDQDEGLIRGTTETVAELENRAKSSRAKLE
jgi:hypothetical protein